MTSIPQKTRKEFFDKITTDYCGSIGSKINEYMETLSEAIRDEETRMQFCLDYINYKKSFSNEDQKTHYFIHDSETEILKSFSSIYKEVLKENPTVQNSYGIMVPDTRSKEFKLILNMWLYTFH